MQQPKVWVVDIGRSSAPVIAEKIIRPLEGAEIEIFHPVNLTQFTRGVGIIPGDPSGLPACVLDFWAHKPRWVIRTFRMLEMAGVPIINQSSRVGPAMDRVVYNTMLRHGGVRVPNFFWGDPAGARRLGERAILKAAGGDDHLTVAVDTSMISGRESLIYCEEVLTIATLTAGYWTCGVTAAMEKPHELDPKTPSGERPQKKDVECTPALTALLHTVHDLLGLEIFSVDVTQDGVCLDVNPFPSGFGVPGACEAIVARVRGIVGK